MLFVSSSCLCNCLVTVGVTVCVGVVCVFVV